MRRCTDGFGAIDDRCPGEPGFKRAVGAVLARARPHRVRRPLGDASGDLRKLPLPPELERYLASGVPMASWRRDLGAVSAQVPRWVYGALAALSVLVAAKAYRNWRDAQPKGKAADR